MKPEPLKDKGRIQKLCYVENALNCYKGLCGDCSSKDFVYNHEDKEIKSAVEWWKKYRDVPEQLIKDYPELRIEIFGVFKCVKTLTLFDFERLKEVSGFDSGYWLDYDLWLLDKAFPDIVKK